jgi:citrate lyase beta subunit
VSIPPTGPVPGGAVPAGPVPGGAVPNSPLPVGRTPGLAGQSGPSAVSAGQPAVAWTASAGAELDVMLAAADRALAEGYPGERPGRQPVHTVYVPADVFQLRLASQWGQQALASLAECMPGAAEFGAAMDLPADLAAEVLPLVQAKLGAEPVEDLRLDFEDGYGDRGDAAEDADARAAAGALAASVAAGLAPPFTGVRCKSLEAATRRRAVATLDVFLGALLSYGPLPGGFVITLPKVSSADQVRAMVHLCGRLEEARGLAPGRLRFEVQVETPQLVLGADGAAEVARCVHAGGPRLTGLHYGTYDYSAALQIAAGDQSMDHPAADYARAVMQVAAAGTGVRLSDGSTNVLPAGDRDQVVAAWRLHSRLVRRSLRRGFYQGWDLHPGQLVSRYAATYAFFRDGLPAAAARLTSYLDTQHSRGADAGLVGQPGATAPARVDAASAGQRGVTAPAGAGSGRAAGRGAGRAEEPATVRALAGYLARGLDCGAVSAGELTGLTGLQPAGVYALCGRRDAPPGPAPGGPQPGGPPPGGPPPGGPQPGGPQPGRPGRDDHGRS